MALFTLSDSQVVLEALPPGVQAAAERHNCEALRLFVEYVRCYVEGLAAGEEEGGSDGTPGAPGGGGAAASEALPLSGVRLPAAPAGACSTAGAGACRVCVCVWMWVALGEYAAACTALHAAACGPLLRLAACSDHNALSC